MQRRPRAAYQRPLLRCAICGSTSVAAARWPIGAVCTPCYSRARARPESCTSCGLTRVLIGASAGSAAGTPDLCGPCSGSRRYAYVCIRCGGGEEPYKSKLCVRCALRDQLRATLGQPKAGGPASILTEALASSRRPRSVMKWLTNPRGGARVLRELHDRGIPVDHAALDAYDEREVWSLRRTLVDLGVLPERHDPIERLDATLERVVANLPGATRQLVRAYGSWSLLPRARRRYERSGTFTYNQFRAAWMRLERVAQLLTWLDARDVALAQLDQATLDVWLVAASHDRRIATADFLRWAARRALAPRLHVTHVQRQEPDVSMTDDQRWAQARRCLSEPTIPDDVRAAGALVLLYGLPLARVVELTRDHLRCEDSSRNPTGLSIVAAGPVVLVPSALGRLLARLPHQTSPRGVPLIPASPSQPPWLFPGRGPQGHVTATGLSARMRRHGLTVRRARNAALISLAGDLPASVLSDLFGLGIAASTRWARRAGRDWHQYLAEVQRES